MNYFRQVVKGVEFADYDARRTEATKLVLPAPFALTQVVV